MCVVIYVVRVVFLEFVSSLCLSFAIAIFMSSFFVWLLRSFVLSVLIYVVRQLFIYSSFRYFFSYVIWFAFCIGSFVIQFVWYLVIRVVRYVVRYFVRYSVLFYV